MKWLSRSEWRDRFAEVYDYHLLPACRRTGFDAEEVMAILGEDLLDQPIPVLGNKSPRAAVTTAKGRAKVVDWLKTLENHTAQMAGHNAELATYDFSWLWTELGVNELRR